MAVGHSDTHVFPGLLTPVLTRLFFSPKASTTFRTYFSRGERRKYAEKKVLDWVSNLHSPGHESDSLTAELLGLDDEHLE